MTSFNDLPIEIIRLVFEYLTSIEIVKRTFNEEKIFRFVFFRFIHFHQSIQKCMLLHSNILLIIQIV
jgi:hypothetical protein